MMKTRDIAKQIYKIYNELKRDTVSALNVISKEIKREKTDKFLMSSTVFEGIIKAIIQQQISLKVAESITANLVERGSLSWRKSMYVKEFSKSVLNGFDPEDLKNKDQSEILETAYRMGLK